MDQTPTPLTIDEQAFVSQFPNVARSKITEKLGAGMGHVVYAYGDDEVLKIPKWRRLKHGSNPTLTAERRIETVDMIARYFGNYALDTTVISSETNPSYLMIQRRLKNFRNLTPSNMHEVGEQLDDLMAINQKLHREQKMSLDFMGKDGMINTVKSRVSNSVEPEMSNLVIEDTPEGPRLVIADMSLLRLGRDNHTNSLSGRRSWIINAVTYGVNRRLIRKRFGYDIAA